MQDKLTLMIPGPTPVPETVLKAMGRHPIGHRSGEFQAIVRRTTEQLKWLHQTTSDVLVITGSGTAAMEAGIINTLSRGDKVLCGDNGKFGERWVKVARAYGLDDEWGLDVVASGAQKGYMLPPGLSFVAMSARAWKAYERSDLPKFYLDLGPYRKTAAKDSNPFTPAVNLYFGLEAALDMMQKEGLDAIFARHARHRAAAQAGMKAMGLPLFAAEGCGSPAITAVAPEGIDAEQLRKAVKEKFDILLAGGQDHLKGQVFRIGHLGYVCDRDVLTAVAAIESTLQSLGLHKGNMGAGVAAASAALG